MKKQKKEESEKTYFIAEKRINHPLVTVFETVDEFYTIFNTENFDEAVKVLFENNNNWQIWERKKGETTVRLVGDKETLVNHNPFTDKPKETTFPAEPENWVIYSEDQPNKFFNIFSSNKEEISLQWWNATKPRKNRKLVLERPGLEPETVLTENVWNENSLKETTITEIPKLYPWDGLNRFEKDYLETLKTEMFQQISFVVKELIHKQNYQNNKTLERVKDKTGIKTNRFYKLAAFAEDEKALFPNLSIEEGFSLLAYYDNQQLKDSAQLPLFPEI